MIVKEIYILPDSSTDPVYQIAGVRLQQSEKHLVYLLVENENLGDLLFDVH